MRPLLAALALAALAPRAGAQAPPAEPPAVNDISAAVFSSSASITWEADQPSDAQVDYGPTPGYGNSTPLDPAPALKHAALLTGLTPGALYHYRVKSRNAAGALGASTDYTFTLAAADAAPPERIPPSVLVMTPAAGSFLSKTVTVSANATDNVGVANVAFVLDGGDLGLALASAPYTFRWDTLTAADGAHALAAVARDAAGNSATSPIVALTVDNAPPALAELVAEPAGPGAAVVRWKTGERADTSVEYGTTTSYGHTASAAAAVVDHAAGLTGLSPGTVYHYRAVSRDQAGNVSASADASFTTPGAAAFAAPAATTAAPGDAAALAPQKLLTPSRADGVNDKAVFGPEAREVSVFDIRGRLVFHAVSPGPGSPLVWDGRDGAGRVVESGVYLATVVKRDGGRLNQSFSIAK